MRRFLTVLLLLWGIAAAGQRTNVLQEVREDKNKCSGLDCIYDFSVPKETPVPKGYDAVYIGHYGRHGSRYAYTDKAYKIPLEMLREGAADGNLTPFGAALLADMEVFWDKVRYRVGDLTPLGWEQHRMIAERMIESYPKAFGKGSRVDACSSPSVRSILSMASEIAAFSRYAPGAAVYAHQGESDVQATRPNMGHNPFRYEGPVHPFPYDESMKGFFLRKLPDYDKVLGRLFTDPAAALGGRDPFDVFFHLYMFVAGMQSLPEDVRMDAGGIFSDDEYAVLWEVDNYSRFVEYFKYRTPCCSIVDDIVEKADARLASGERGADLRFGHDHVVMALLMIMDLDGFGHIPATPDEVAWWFQSFRSPMATNIQYVFCVPRKAGKEVLVKVLLNGEEVRLGSLEPVSGPYYRWPDVKDFLAARTALFVYRD